MGTPRGLTDRSRVLLRTLSGSDNFPLRLQRDGWCLKKDGGLARDKRTWKSHSFIFFFIHLIISRHLFSKASCMSRLQRWCPAGQDLADSNGGM